MIFSKYSHGIRLDTPHISFLRTLLHVMCLCLRLHLFTMVDSDFSLPYVTLIHMITIKLTSPNYLLWRNQVETLLTSQYLSSYLNSSKLMSPSSSSDVAIQKTNKDWLAQDRWLHSLLLSSLIEESVAETLGCKNPTDVWTALEKANSLRSKTQEIQLNDELQHLCTNNDYITVYSTKFCSYCD